MSFEKSTNLFEIAILDPCVQNEDLCPNKHFSVFKTCVSENFFHACLEKIAKKKSPYKFFPKSFKTYIFNDLYLENSKNQDTNLYAKNMRAFAHHKDKNVLYTFWEKNKKAFHAFPSTSHLSCVLYTNRLVFRVNQRVYFNFDIFRYAENENKLFYKIFININGDKSADILNDFSFVDTLIHFVD